MDEPTDLATAAELVNQVAADATGWHEVASELHRVASSAEDPIHVLACAFDYMLDVRRRDRSDKHAFEPMMRFEGGEAFPPELPDVPPEWVGVWAFMAERALAAASRSRLHDLLCELREGDIPHHAAEAVAGYRDVARLSSWHAVDRADCLARALTLSRRFGLPDHDDLLRQMVDATATSLAAAEPEPGVALSLLAKLLDDDACPDRVDELLERARSTYRGAHLTEDVIELQKRRARGDVERLKELERTRVEAWLSEADVASGLVRVVHLETAARLARAAGLRDLEERAQQRLQAIPKEELELQHVSAEASIPSEVVDEYLRPFTEAETVQDLLIALISHPPATGYVEDNRRSLQQSRVEFPLQFLFPRVVLGGDHLPRWSPGSETEQEDGDLARQELLRFQVVGDLLARGLWLGAEGREFTIEEVESFIADLPNQVPGVPKRLASALSSYWNEDWTAACFLALPCVEALCRSLVLSLERGIYETQRGKRPGQYPGLGVLLRWMRDEGLDESWYRYMWTVLASPAGMNLRNEVAHGFALQTGSSHAAAVIHMALYLAALHIEVSTGGGPAGSDS